MTFKSSMDSTARISSTLLISIFAGVIILALTPSAFQSANARNFAILAIVAVLFLLFRCQVRFYEITKSSLRIARLFNSIYIPLDRIEYGEPVEKSAISGSVRRWGSYGFFGYTGLFRNKQFGLMRWFMTNQSSIVCIRMINKEVYFLSPDDYLSFCRELGKVKSSAR